VDRYTLRNKYVMCRLFQEQLTRTEYPKKRRFGWSIELTEKQHQYIIRKYRLHDKHYRQVILINYELHLLRIFDKPCLFISGIYKPESFLEIKDKYVQELKQIT